MTRDKLYRRIIDQFSNRSNHAEIWRGFDLFMNTSEFLNLGYARWYQPYLLGSSQLRLARLLANGIKKRYPRLSVDDYLLDIGCGRGGPTIHFAESLGVRVIGVDLVEYNLTVASQNASDSRGRIDFIANDSHSIPFKEGSFTLCTAVDSIVYFQDKTQFFTELSAVMKEGGLVAIADLMMANETNHAQRFAVDQFANNWDMPPLLSVKDYQETILSAGLTIEETQDISHNSTARFRKWSRLYLFLSQLRVFSWVGQLVFRGGIDLSKDSITQQIRSAHAALPHLRHVILYVKT